MNTLKERNDGKSTRQFIAGGFNFFNEDWMNKTAIHYNSTIENRNTVSE